MWKPLIMMGKAFGVIFETTSPFDTPRHMEELVKWVNWQLKEKELHPLLTISLFIVHFFGDTSVPGWKWKVRILTALLLLNEGYSYVPYSSLESVIEKNKDNYYLALRRTQATFKSDNPDYETWILLFLNALEAQKEMLSQKIERERIFTKLPKLSIRIIELVKAHGQLSISEIESITNANRDTLKVKLRVLVNDRYLIRQGRGKGTRYTIGNV